jgi:ABC-2 type transport system permease protein
MTLATMVSRFVFPLVSLEGRRFWILGLVPVERRRILVAKFVFSLGGALLLTEFLVLLSNYILRCSGFVLAAQAVTAALICVGLTGLAVGMGALFPNLRETNPSKIVSGFGGTLTLILSVTIVMVAVVGEGLVCHYYLVYLRQYLPAGEAGAHFGWALAGVLVLVTLLTSLAAYVPMRLARRALERMEF